MKRLVISLTALFAALNFCALADVNKPEPALPDFIKVSKIGKDTMLTITGRISSRHSGFRKGRSVRSYILVTPDMRKIKLPRSIVEHRDGTVSGINLKPLKGKTVRLSCKGRIKHTGGQHPEITVKKIISVTAVQP